MTLRSVALTASLTVSIIFAIFGEVKPSLSQISQLNNQEAYTNKLEIVQKRADLIRLTGQQVKLIGCYTFRSWQPNPQSTGIPGFQGVYIQSQIVLEDGTKVNIFSRANKQSLRSPDEVEKYNDKIVEAIGVVHFETQPAPSFPKGEFFINLNQLNLYERN